MVHGGFASPSGLQSRSMNASLDPENLCFHHEPASAAMSQPKELNEESRFDHEVCHELTLADRGIKMKYVLQSANSRTSLSFPHASSGNPGGIRTGPPIKTFGVTILRSHLSGNFRTSARSTRRTTDW